MILETLRVFADGFANEEYGVNAILDSLPTDAVDEAPRRIASVLDVTRSKTVASGEDPLDDPWLAIVQDGPSVSDGEVATVHRDTTSVPVLVLYGTNREGDEGLAEALYVCRAVTRSVREIMRDARVAERTRNGVCVMSVNSIESGPVKIEGLATVKAAVRLDAYVREVGL